MHKNKPSMTAYKVAMNILTLSAVPEMKLILPKGIIEVTEKLLIASGVTKERLVRWAKSKQMVSVYKAFDWILPGQFEAFGYRKAFCEYQVRDGIKEGATQILVLGAGYDTLGWRLAPEFSEVNFFEIDHPNTAYLKAKGIEKMGTRSNLHLIAEDLGETKIIDVLNANQFWDSKAKSVVIAEGLLMYLNDESVKGFFSSCAEISRAGSRIAFSYIPAGENGCLDAGRWTGLMLWLQKLAGEPWAWSIQPEKLGKYLEEFGWKLKNESIEKHGVEFFNVATK